MFGVRVRLAGLLIAVAATTACGGDALFDFAPNEPVVDCIGVPAEQCRNAVAEAEANAGGSPVAAVSIRCTAASCTADEGAISVTVVLADGSRSTSMSAWALAPATAADDPVEVPLPVKPTCVGVPLPACEQLAKDSLQHLDRPPDSVVSILVRCEARTVCLEDRGAGSVDLTFRDGTHRTSQWAYEGSILP